MGWFTNGSLRKKIKGAIACCEADPRLVRLDCLVGWNLVQSMMFLFSFHPTVLFLCCSYEFNHKVFFRSDSNPFISQNTSWQSGAANMVVMMNTTLKFARQEIINKRKPMQRSRLKGFRRLGAIYPNFGQVSGVGLEQNWNIANPPDRRKAENHCRISTLKVWKLFGSGQLLQRHQRWLRPVRLIIHTTSKS